MLTGSVKKWRSWLMAALLVPASAMAITDAPVLEEYAISHKGDAGFSASLQDEKLGENGGKSSALCRIDYISKTNGGELKIKVWRKSNTNVPIALSFDVTIYAYNSQGDEIYNLPLSGRTFGNNQGGKWETVQNKIPAGAADIVVTFTGSYR